MGWRISPGSRIAAEEKCTLGNIRGRESALIAYWKAGHDFAPNVLGLVLV